MAKKSNNQPAESATYNIKAVVNQTGLNPATIRAWERRYGLPQPQRSDGGHRQYSQQDIDTLNWLIAHQATGMSISHAVDLWQTLIENGEDPLQQDAARESDRARIAVPVLGKQMDELRDAWITACLSYDRETAELVLTHAFSLFPPEVVCLELLRKGLVEVGNGWHNGTVTVQQEHFTTTISEQRLEMLIGAAPAPTRPERIIVSAAPGERHTFGPYLLTFFLRRQGWDVIHLGADVPVEDFEPTIERLNPDLIIVSAQLFHTAASIKDVAVSAKNQNTLLAFGGRAFNVMPEIRDYIAGFFLGASLEEAVDTVSQLLRQRPNIPEPIIQDGIHREAMTRFRERRALIESHVWGTFIATNKSTQFLSAINDDVANAITAALKLGAVSLLSTDIHWLEEQLFSYHEASTFIQEYVRAYRDGAKIHLGDPARIIVDWLEQVVASIDTT